jgi:GxxExxY protein
MENLVYPDESYKILGACFEVYNEMGSGFLEQVYQECLAIEFRNKNIPYSVHPQLRLKFREMELKSYYFPDFVLYDCIILEIKAAAALIDQHRAQVHNYLKATGYRLGILVNFGEHPKIKYERIVR